MVNKNGSTRGHGELTPGKDSIPRKALGGGQAGDGHGDGDQGPRPPLEKVLLHRWHPGPDHHRTEWYNDVIFLGNNLRMSESRSIIKDKNFQESNCGTP